MIFFYFEFLQEHLRGRKCGTIMVCPGRKLAWLRTVSALVEMAQENFDTAASWTRVDELCIQLVLKPASNAMNCWSV